MNTDNTREVARLIRLDLPCERCPCGVFKECGGQCVDFWNTVIQKGLEDVTRNRN